MYISSQISLIIQLLNKVLGDLHQRYSNFTVVRLNGLLHAEDERITAQHFIRHITQESDADIKVNK